MKDWQTTVAGIAALLGAVILICLGHTAEGAVLIPVAIGLWRAKDTRP